MKLINNIAKKHSSFSIFAGVGERTRKGTNLYFEMQMLKVMQIDGESKASLIYGQMNKASGARAMVGFTVLYIAEYFKDEKN
jgi:F0F1-type ATP synthase beta subunit